MYEYRMKKEKKKVRNKLNLIATYLSVVNYYFIKEKNGILRDIK